MITADTNIFIYGVDPADLLKQAIARHVIIRLRRTRGPLALQVVGEFQNVASRKLKVERSIVARYALALFKGFETFPASWSAACAALDEMAAGRLSYWDALMLASAAETGCTVMLSRTCKTALPCWA